MLTLALSISRFIITPWISYFYALNMKMKWCHFSIPLAVAVVAWHIHRCERGNFETDCAEDKHTLTHSAHTTPQNRQTQWKRPEYSSFVGHIDYWHFWVRWNIMRSIYIAHLSRFTWHSMLSSTSLCISTYPHIATIDTLPYHKTECSLFQIYYGW